MDNLYNEYPIKQANTVNKIHYAFGRDYLKSWTIKDALREVFQNYIDYGEYTINIIESNDPDYIGVNIRNNYIPNNLEFLRLGNTSKDDGNSIGHHGEGLKAAFLIFTREGYHFTVETNGKALNGKFEQSEDIGETFNIEYYDCLSLEDGFITDFYCLKKDYEDFISNIITKYDILYSDDYFGDLLKPEKGIGNIYSGNLFVCHIDNLNYSYNIKPQHFKLDRDRRAPADWDVDYATSKILSSYKKTNSQSEQPYTDYNSRDAKYYPEVTDRDLEVIEPVTIDNKVQYYHTIHKEVINNSNVKDILNKHPKFKKDLILNKKEKFNRARINAGKKSVLNLLKQFKEEYCKGSENMSIDIDIIIYKLNKQNGRK